jgi:hypothetical protein
MFISNNLSWEITNSFTLFTLFGILILSLI